MLAMVHDVHHLFQFSKRVKSTTQRQDDNGTKVRFLCAKSKGEWFLLAMFREFSGLAIYAPLSTTVTEHNRLAF